MKPNDPPPFELHDIRVKFIRMTRYGWSSLYDFTSCPADLFDRGHLVYTSFLLNIPASLVVLASTRYDGEYSWWVNAPRAFRNLALGVGLVPELFTCEGLTFKNSF